MEQPIKTTSPTRLLALRVLSVRRRLSAGGPVVRGLVLLLVPAALVALWWALQHLAQTAATGIQVHEGTTVARALREHVFWLNAGPVLIWSYTTFEVVFRSRDAVYLNTLPIRGVTRSVDIIVRAYLVHLPLALPALIYGVALVVEGAGTAGVYAIVVGLLTWLSTVPAATAIQLAAGRSLLTDATAIRKLLSGQIVASEEAMLLWSPAGAVVVGLVLVVVYELLLFHGMLAGRGNLQWWPYAVALGVTLYSLRASHQAVTATLFGIIARFAQAEVPPPYTDAGVPETTRGEGLARYLPRAARPFYTRDRRQLRRRYRIDNVLVLVFAIIAGRLALATTSQTTSWDLASELLIALVGVVGVFLVTAFRTRGELSSPYLDASLPSEPAASRLGRLAAGALEPAACVGIATLAALISGDIVATLIVAAAGLATTALLLVLSEALAQQMGTHRVSWAAVIWRIMVLTAVAVATGVVSATGGAG